MDVTNQNLDGDLYTKGPTRRRFWSRFFGVKMPKFMPFCSVVATAHSSPDESLIFQIVDPSNRSRPSKY